MKSKILVAFLAAILSFAGASAQGFFHPIPPPRSFSAVPGSRFALASDSINNSIRPIVNASVTFGDGTTLASGIGVGFQHNKWDVASQSWVTIYSISALGFVGTNGGKITGTAGLVIGIPGTNGLIGAGAGYDFTLKHVVPIVSAQFKFN